MSDSTRISGPVNVQSDSRQRVAYDLMERIAGWDAGKDQEKRSRDYWLRLYSQCYSVVDGGSAEHALTLK